MELRATTTRSIALAGVGALAVYGSVAVEGAHHDLVRGLDRELRPVPRDRRPVGHDRRRRPDDQQLRRRRGCPAAIARAPGRRERARLPRRPARRRRPAAVDHRPRPPPTARSSRRASCVRATSRGRPRGIRAGGWAAVSDVFARAQAAARRRPLRAADADGRDRLRVAAITTNLGWPPGGVILDAARLPPRAGAPPTRRARGRPRAGRLAGRRRSGRSSRRSGRRRACASRRWPSARRSTRRWRVRA